MDNIIHLLNNFLHTDIEKGLRREDIIQHSLAGLLLYDVLNTEKIDTTTMTAEEVAQRIGGL